jgi:hypothetical protein
MPTVRELIVQWTSRFDPRGLKTWNREVDKGKKKTVEAEKSVKKLTDAFAKFGIAIGAAVLINRTRQLVTEFIRAGDELDKTSQQIGFTIEQLSAWRHAAGLSGVGANEFSDSVGQLQFRMRQAAQGSQQYARAFREMGIEVKTADGSLRPASDVLFDIADAISRVESPAEKTALVMTVLGRQGRKLLPMFTGGAEGVRRMTGELRTLGGGISREAVQRSVELTDTLARFRVSMQSLASVLAVSILPKLDQWIQALIRGAVWLQEVTQNSHILRAAAIVVGAALATAGIMTAAAWGPAALTVGLATAAIVLAALAIDDLWVTVEGGDSVLQGFIDGMFGFDATTQIINNARQAWEDLTGVISEAVEAVQSFGEWLDSLPHVSRLFIVPREDIMQQRQQAEAASGLARRTTHLRRTRRQQVRSEDAALMAELGLALTPEEAIGAPGTAQTVQGATVAGALRQTIQRPGLVPPPPTREMRLLERSIEMPGRPLMRPTELGRSQVTQNIGDASMTVQVTVEGTPDDPAATARAVEAAARRVAREENEQMLRGLEESLAPVGAR